jgi:hypothetical protein
MGNASGRYLRHKQTMLRLHQEGYTPGEISKYLEMNTGDELEKSGIRKFLGRELGDQYKANSGYGSNWDKARKERKESPQNKIESQMVDNGLIQDYGANWKHAWLKDKNGASIFVTNTSEIISFDDMRNDLMLEMKEHSPKYEKIERKRISDPHLLVVDIADLHIGKLADEFDTGSNYDHNKAIERALDGLDGIIQKASGFPIDKILFVIGNDVLHTDNSAKTSTKGTPQDVSQKWYRNYLDARRLYVKAIETLMLIADIHIVHNPSNHDYVSGFMLADSIYCWFRNCENITFDISMRHRKYFKYGESLISTSHGDGAKMEQLPLIMANEAKEDWANTKWRYIYLHHIHHKDQFKFRSGKDYQGCTVEYMRSPSGTDSWHHKAGYQHAPKAIEGFIHSKEFGQVARLTHLFM